VAALGQNGQKLSELAVKMEAVKKLEFYFPKAMTEECIHVIVQPPPQPSKLGELGQIHWLTE
jgi:hypothetical protein